MAIRFPTTASYLSLTGAGLSIAADGSVFVQLRNPAPDLTGSQFRNGLTIFTGGTADYSDAYIDLAMYRSGANQVVSLDVWNGVDPAQNVEHIVPSHQWVTGGVAFTYTAATGEFEMFVNGVSQGTVTMDMSGLSATSVIIGSIPVPTVDIQAGISVEYPRIVAAVLTGAQLAAEGASATPLAMIAIGLSPLATIAALGAWTLHGAPVDAFGPLDQPTNLTPATATPITVLPYTVSADATSAPTSALVPTCGTPDSGLWWVYTPPTGVTAIGLTLISTSDPANYQPDLSVWLGTLPLSLAQRADCCYDFKDPTTAAIAVTPGVPNYLLIANDVGGTPPEGSFTVTVQALIATAPAGALLVTSDTRNQATVILSATDGASLRAIGMAPSEMGDFLPSGILAIMAETPSGGSGAYAVDLWNVNLTMRIASITSIIRATQATMSPIRAANGTFYVASVVNVGASVINMVSPAGVVSGTSWTLPANSAGLSAIGVTPNGNTLYYSNPTINTPIYAYNLAGSAALPNFLAAPGANRQWLRDIWVTAIGDVLIILKDTGAVTYAVKRYNAAGALQTTYAIATTTLVPRIGLSADSLSFWVMSFPSNGVSRFQKFVIAGGGAASVNFTVAQNSSTGNGPVFGPTQSCPLLVLPVDSFPYIPPPGPGTRSLIRRLRRFPLPFDRNLFVFVNALEFLIQPGTGTTDGIGEDPMIDVRFSGDGGNIWGPTIRVPSGKLGEYLHRPEINNIGRLRNGVCEISMDAPIDWALLEAYIEAELGRA